MATVVTPTAGGIRVVNGDIQSSVPGVVLMDPVTGQPTALSTSQGAGGLTDAQLRAAPVDVNVVSGGTGGGGTTGGLTDVELRAAPVPVSGPVTDAQLRANPVPTTGPLTDTQLRAAAVPISLDPATLTNVGAPTDAAAGTDIGNFSIISLIKRSLSTYWSVLLDRITATGVIVRSGPGTVVQATVTAGTSLSAAIDLDNARLGRIGCPAAVDGTKLTFQTSTAINGTFRDLYKDDGNEYTVTIAANRACGVDLSMFATVRFLKVRQGVAAAANNAAADRVYDLSLMA